MVPLIVWAVLVLCVLLLWEQWDNRATRNCAKCGPHIVCYAVNDTVPDLKEVIH